MEGNYAGQLGKILYSDPYPTVTLPDFRENPLWRRTSS